MCLSKSVAWAAFLYLASVSAGSLADVEHVVLFMQENRAFIITLGQWQVCEASLTPTSKRSTVVPFGISMLWKQAREAINRDSHEPRNVNSTLSNVTDALLPWYLNYLGGDWPEATQCLVAGGK